eukprot:CAMPEP_0206192968 /NCGR_PEP_ID=MMETSP0166-20121206/6283_1 /ASSEMBLY_ACC=CAM_ASM_000260 /TAXON_ID=95228 /ORGANISM="Vannella robusta, Strain DIVA3 518/3/11/1/6" /LENGTH=257 /DNA_ID=CAMNT_0053609583 /DNA_START=567 /DNA_END=1337 /DNA_ORIENTATION=-
MKKKQIHVQEQRRRVETANARHQALARQIEEIKREQKQLKQEVSELQEDIEASTKLLDTWNAFREEKLPAAMQSVQCAAKLEQQLLANLMGQIREDPSALAALSDAQSKKSTLSLVFNMAGLSEDVITKLSGVSGDEFLNSPNFFSSYFDIKLDEQKDLEYLRLMMACGQFPYDDHVDQCVVCCCDTAEKLWDLLEEHSGDIDISVLNLVMLESHSITGPRALVLTRPDMKSLWNCDTEEINKAVRIVLYLLKLHRD